MTRQKYGDTRSAGRSKLVPYREGESASERHERRHAVAETMRADIEAFCQARSIALKISNDGHHWRFVRGDRSADWWPSSAKMVFDQKWERGIHVHDVEQAKRLLVRNGVAGDEP